jgi:UDP-N-acetylglucosamine 2-epimerase
MKVLSIVGNRPQFIKSAPVSLALREHGIEEVVVHTGQHYDRELSQVFFDELELAEPRYALGLKTADPTAMRGAILQTIEAERPNCVLVFGDTNSTLAGALAAEDTGVRLAHVEAGLRSGDWSMPEERNRVETDKRAALLFCPDFRSARTLTDEGVNGLPVITGDVMADASMRLAPIAREHSTVLDRYRLQPGTYLVATVHREANVFQPRLGRIVGGLNQLEETVIFPAHPRTRAALEWEDLDLGSHIRLEPPLGYLDLAALASQARVILTDSGGLQKEAYWYGVPCVTLRPTTEWMDTVDLGANELVDDDPAEIVAAVSRAEMPSERPSLYGDGWASERIAQALSGFPDTLSP